MKKLPQKLTHITNRNTKMKLIEGNTYSVQVYGLGARWELADYVGIIREKSTASNEVHGFKCGTGILAVKYDDINSRVRPGCIQPYYYAWMVANPDLPRAWQKKEWENNGCNVKYMLWIQDKHRDFRKIKGLPPYMPYSEQTANEFRAWLFDQVGVTEEQYKKLQK